MKQKIAIIIPTYNESENIQKLILNIHENINKLDYTIFIVDDNSPDGTAKIVENLKQKYPIKIILRKKNKGYGNSCIDGLKMAAINNDIIFTMDADLSHNPKYIKKFLEKFDSGADIVIGSRYIKHGKILNWPKYRKIISKFANLFTQKYLNLKVKDCTSGFRAYKKEVIKKLDLNKINSTGYSFLEEILYKCAKNNFIIKETPIIFIDRADGKSKLSKKEMIKFLFSIIALKLKK